MALIKSKPLAPADRPERKSDRDCENLEVQLNDASAEARRWAARDMVDCPHSASALVARLNVETDQAVREVIFTTLTRLGDSTAVAGLVDCLRSEDATLRNEAIEAMKLLPDAVSPIMQGLLNDADSDVRIFAVNILEALRHPDVEQWLTDVIENDAHVNVCATAVDILGEVGSQAALESLRKLKTRFAKEPYIQFAADLAIKRILED
jgi:HEAT repeat protein